MNELVLHLLAVLMSVGVIIAAYFAKNSIGGIIGSTFSLIYLGAAFLAIPHGLEIFEIMGIEIEFVEHNHALIEHLFFYLGTGSIIAAFFRIYNTGKAASK